ncbi:hypothetical protein [Kitasatospora sp. NPDC057015]|uniref:hypothetical protein n=1 Tax=Kitasatospora sp. NPDC057015 TaxID=3346001 RepID=UPI003630629A
MSGQPTPEPGRPPAPGRGGPSAQATGFAQVFQAAGDMVVYQGGEPYRLAPWPLAGPDGAETPQIPVAGEGPPLPSMLLRAGSAVVDFAGRTTERERLRRWRDDGAALGVFLLHGPGGQGKTRLAFQTAAEWRARGWVVLGAFHRRDRQAPPAFPVPEDLERAPGVLVVVDYAERWDTEDLLTLLTDTHVGARRGIPVRILLLARPAGPWWQNLAFRIEHALHVVPARSELPPLEDDPGVSRAELFTAARDRFADLLGVPGARTVGQPPELATHDDYRLVLTVHMAALATVLAARRTAPEGDRVGTEDLAPTPDGGGPPGDPVEVSAFLLARERDHWSALHSRTEDPLAVTPDAMAQLVYTATLTGPLPRTDGKQALERVGIESREAPGQMLKEHARCYPPSAPGRAEPGSERPEGATAATVLEPLHPDRMGEDFLALTLLDPAGQHCDHPTDPWADGAPARLLEPSAPAAPGARPAAATEEVAPVWSRHAVTTLIEAAARWPHLARIQLYPLLRDRPALALQAGGAALAALARHPHVDPDLLEAIDRLLPERHIELDIAAAVIAERLADRRLAAAVDDPARRARIHGDLALRLNRAGRRDQAVPHSDEAVARWRELATTDREAHLPELAVSLANHAVWLAEAGRRDRALTFSGEAVALRQELVALNRDAYLPDLAQSLTNHSGQLAEVGRHAEAVTHSAQALDVYWELVGLERDAHLPELAAAVTNHAGRLAEVGRQAEALPLSGEAVVLYRELVGLERDAHLPELAAAVTNHAVLMAETGREAEALAASGEAVVLYRELAGLNRDAHLPRLATAVTNHASTTAEAGRREEALTLSEEGVALCRELVELNRPAHLPGLTASLGTHALRLSEEGRLAEALSVSGEAVALSRVLAGANRVAHLPELAGAVINHAGRLAEVGRRAEALLASDEAVALCGELVGVNRAAHLPVLAGAVTNRARWLAEAGRSAEALAASGDGVALHRELAGANRAARLPQLAGAVLDHALRLAAVGRRAEALRYGEEAVALCGEFSEVDRAAHLPVLAGAVTNRARWLAEAGRSAEALAASGEAEVLYRELVGQDREAHLSGLAETLGIHAARLAQAGRRAEALAASEEGVALYRELVGLNRTAEVSGLAEMLGIHAARLAQAGRRAEALAASGEAVVRYRELVGPSRDAHLPGLADTLTFHAGLLVAAGKVAEALIQAGNAVGAFRELVGVDRDAHRSGHVRSITMLGFVMVMDSRFSEAVFPLVDALGMVRELPEDERSISEAIRGALRDAHSGDPDGVAERYRAVTGEEAPTWMTGPG